MNSASDLMNVKRLNRRAFIQGSALVLVGAGGLKVHGAEAVEVGLITDLHYADKETRGSRHYRDSKEKIKDAVGYFNEKKPAFVIELGDFIDRAVDVETELRYLKVIEKEYSKLKCDRYYVFGNHCLDTLKKEEFIAHTGMKAPHYSFDAGGYHFVVLDACYNSKGEAYERRNFKWNDANVPKAELDWLREDLKKTKKPTIVFSHQRVDPSGNYEIKNAGEVRKVLEDSGKVRAVFSGHSHKNEYQLVGGIHYCVVRAMVEGAGKKNSGYAMLRLEGDGKLMVKGFVKQDDYAIDGEKVEIKPKEKKAEKKK